MLGVGNNGRHICVMKVQAYMFMHPQSFYLDNSDGIHAGKVSPSPFTNSNSSSSSSQSERVVGEMLFLAVGHVH